MPYTESWDGKRVRKLTLYKGEKMAVVEPGEGIRHKIYLVLDLGLLSLHNYQRKRLFRVLFKIFTIVLCYCSSVRQRQTLKV
jgi:hypothetical protein